MHHLVCGLMLLAIGDVRAADPYPLKIEPLWFRDQAVSAPLPILEHNVQGAHFPLRIVAELLVSPSGEVTRATLLEQEHLPASSTLLSALRQWRFKTYHQLFPREVVEHDRLGRVILYLKDNPKHLSIMDAAETVLREEMAQVHK